MVGSAQAGGASCAFRSALPWQDAVLGGATSDPMRVEIGVSLNARLSCPTLPRRSRTSGAAPLIPTKTDHPT